MIRQIMTNYIVYNVHPVNQTLRKIWWISVTVGTSLDGVCSWKWIKRLEKVHMYQGPHLYIWPWSMQIYNFFQLYPWLCNQRTHGSVTTEIAGNTVHSSCRYWRSRWVFPFLNHFFFYSNIEFVGQIFSIRISFYILILFL